MEIKIEPVKITEAEKLSDISIKSFYDTYHEHNSEEDMSLFLKKSFTTEVLTKEIKQPSNHFFFAKANDDIAGYIKLSTAATPDEIEAIDALEIARIYVVKEKIGSGVGKSMMDFAFSFAKHNNKKIIWLGVWENNLRAIKFYQNYGFEKFSRHVFMVGNDKQTDWLMKTELKI